MTVTTSWLNLLRASFEKALGHPLNSWEALSKKFQVRELSDREHFVSAGELWEDICFVQKGLIRVYYVDQSGNELTQHFYQPGEVVSPLEDPQGTPCLFYIQSLEESTIVTANYGDLTSEHGSNPEWAILELHLIKKGFLKNAKHEAQLLLGNAESRYSWFCREYPDLLEKLTQQQIASFLGVTSVTISRIKNS